MSTNIDVVSQNNSSVNSENYDEVYESENVVNFYSALAAQNHNNVEDWFIDSGATKHMTNVDHDMQNVKKPSIKQVKAANGEKIDIIRTGDLKCKINNNSNFILRDVQYIPKMCVNLLSVSQMVKNGCTVIFNVDGCRTFSKERQLLASGSLVDDMFKIKVQVMENACAAHFVKNNDVALLTHINFGALKSLLKLQVTPDTKCIVCAKGKHSRTPFNEPGTRATKLLELIHTDVCGPLPVRSLAEHVISLLTMMTSAKKSLFTS